MVALALRDQWKWLETPVAFYLRFSALVLFFPSHAFHFTGDHVPPSDSFRLPMSTLALLTASGVT